MKLSKLVKEVCSCEDSEDLQYRANKALDARLDTSFLKEPPLDEMNNPCWEGYEMVGTKKQNGKEVPNCVPVKEVKSPSYMSKSNLEAMKSNVEFLLSQITDDTPLDDWIESAITVAAHELSQVADSMRGKTNKQSKKQKNSPADIGKGYTDKDGTTWTYDDASDSYVSESKPAKGKKWKTNGVSHGQKGVRISPGTPRGDAYCARSYGIKGNWKNDPKSPNRLSRKKWKCRGKKSMKV